MPQLLHSWPGTGRGKEAESAWCLLEVRDLHTELTACGFAKDPPTFHWHTCVARWTQVIQAKSAQSCSIGLFPAASVVHLLSLNRLLIFVLNPTYKIRGFRVYFLQDRCLCCHIKYTITNSLLSLSTTCGQLSGLLTANCVSSHSLTPSLIPTCSTGFLWDHRKRLIYEEVTRSLVGMKGVSLTMAGVKVFNTDSDHDEMNTAHSFSLFVI